MITRRYFFRATTAMTVLYAGAASAGASCIAHSLESQSATTPSEALNALKDGNERFVTGELIRCNLEPMVKATSRSQFPIATVVGCMDSRVPPELVFDQKIGDIFSVRIAGNFVNQDILGSLEFACKVAGSKAIVVLGHTDCGAIKGAIDKAELGNLTALLRNFDTAIATTEFAGERTSKNHDLVNAVATQNARLTAKAILEGSSVLAEMAERNEIVVVAAMHDVATGRITWS